METQQLIDKLEKLRVKEGSTYNAEMIGLMGAEVLDLLPNIIEKLKAGQELREGIEKLDVEVYSEASDHEEYKQFVAIWRKFRAKRNELLEIHDKSITP